MNAALQESNADRHLRAHRNQLMAVRRAISVAAAEMDALASHRSNTHAIVNQLRTSKGDHAAQALAETVGHDQAIERLVGEILSGTLLGKFIYSPHAQQHYTPYRAYITPNAGQPENT